MTKIYAKGKEILTPKAKEFADNYLETENQRMSAMKTFGMTNPASASRKAQTLMEKDVVREYIQQEAAGAMSRIVKLSKQSKNLNVNLAANKDIMDRAGYKPQEAQVNINVPIYLPAEIMDKYIQNQPLPPQHEPQIIDIPQEDD